MTVIDYENILDVTLDIASQDVWSNTSSVPWVNTPSIDAATSITNLPEADVETTPPDLVWWSSSIVWTASTYNSIAWSAWTINLADWTSYSVDAGNKTSITTVTYIYYNWTTTLQTTTTPQDAVWTDKIMVCVVKSVTDTWGKCIVQPFGTVWTNLFITADNIASNTITSNEIASNTITASQINSWYVYAWYLNADRITTGTITGRTIQTASSWQRVVINKSGNNKIRFYDNYWNSAWYLYGNYNSSVWAAIYANGTLVTDGFYNTGRYLWNITPYSSNYYTLWTSSYSYNGLYLWSSNNILSATSSNMRWNGNYVPYINWAGSTVSETIALRINYAWANYWINARAA